MVVSKLKAGAMAFLVTGLVAVGGGSVGYQRLVAGQGNEDEVGLTNKAKPTQSVYDVEQANGAPVALRHLVSSNALTCKHKRITSWRNSTS